MSLDAHAPSLGMLWAGYQSELRLARLAAVEGKADNHVHSLGRLWTGQLSHSSALSLDGGSMAGPRPASVLQVSGPGLRGGCREMLQGYDSLQVSAACAATEEVAVATPGLCRRTGRGRGGGCQSAGGPSRGPTHRASRRPLPSRSACAMIWGLVLHEGRLVLQLDCDKGVWKGIPRHTGLAVRL